MLFGLFRKKLNNTGPKIEKGMCWEQIIEHSVRSCGNDGCWEDIKIPISHFFLCVSVSHKKATMIMWTADNLIFGDTWSLVEYPYVNLPDDVKVVKRIIRSHDIYDMAFVMKEVHV